MLEEGPHGQRPPKASIMAELRRAGVEFSPLDAGSALYAQLKEILAAESEPSSPKASPSSGPDLSNMNRKELVKQAVEEGVDLDAIEGSGTGGNVLVGDIRDAIEAKRKG